jgi:thiol-disulfide isomerase/thioredoxin
MKKILLVSILVALIDRFPVSGQDIQPVSIGQVVPAIHLKKITGYKTVSANLSDFRGKIIILDFWATWCAPCIRGLPGLDTMQTKYRNDLQVLPVTSEKGEWVAAFLKKRKNIHLLSVVEDSLLLQYFPRRVIPHSVMLDRAGKVIAITDPGFFTDSVIERVIAGYAIHLPLKEDNITFDKSKPLFVEGNNNNNLADQLLYRSMITKHIDGVNSGFNTHTKIDAVKTGFSCRNITLPHLFLIALRQPDYYMSSRLCLENVKDSGRYLVNHSGDPQVYRNWLENNTFCYDLVSSASLPEETRYRIMLKDMEQYFSNVYGLTCGMQERELPCYDLIKTGNSELLISAGGPSLIAFMAETEKVVYENVMLPEYVTQLEQQLGMPVYDNTGITKPVSLSIDQSAIIMAQKNKDLTEINQILKGYELKLVPSKRKFTAFVMSEVSAN